MLNSTTDDAIIEGGRAMKIFVPHVLEKQSWVIPRDMEDHERLFALNGQRQENWRPIAMTDLLYDDEGVRRGHSDMPWYNAHVLMLRQKAVRALGPILLQYGELLPLISEQPLSLFNITFPLYALDEEESDIVRFDDGDVMTIDRPVFRADVIDSAHMFRLRLHSGGCRAPEIYLQETMIDLIKESGVKGVGFKLVWSDEAAIDGGMIIRL